MAATDLLEVRGPGVRRWAGVNAIDTLATSGLDVSNSLSIIPFLLHSSQILAAIHNLGCPTRSWKMQLAAILEMPSWLGALKPFTSMLNLSDGTVGNSTQMGVEELAYCLVASVLSIRRLTFLALLVCAGVYAIRRARGGKKRLLYVIID